MTTKWYIRNGENKFLATGGFNAYGPNTVGWVERFQDAASFDSLHQAADILISLNLPPCALAHVVDYFDHPPTPQDADTTPAETVAERTARVAREEAGRLRIRQAWALVKKVATGGAVVLAVLATMPSDTDAARYRHHRHAIHWRHHVPAPTVHAPVRDHARRVLLRSAHARVGRVAHASVGHAVVPGAPRSLLGSFLGGLSAPFSAAGGAVAAAERYVGTNPTVHASLWCADFVNLIERQLGRPGTGSREARSFLHYGDPLAPTARRPGDIVVFSRRGGGHVGYYVSGPASRPVTVSGNAGGNAVRVGTTRLPVIAYRRP